MTLNCCKVEFSRNFAWFRVWEATTWNIVVRQMALPAFQWDRTTQCCRAFTLALARLSCNLPGFTFLVPAHSGGPGHLPEEVKRLCVCVCVCVIYWTDYWRYLANLHDLLTLESAGWFTLHSLQWTTGLNEKCPTTHVISCHPPSLFIWPPSSWHKVVVSY